MESERPPEFVEALAKGLAVIESFDAGHSEMSLSDIARRAGLTPAAARRSLITLIALGYAGQNGKRFFLKPKVMSLGSSFYFATRIDEMLLPELRHLVGLFGDASSVATLDGKDVIYIAHYSVQRARRASAVIGARYPAHATSLGRVLLAGLPDDRLAAYFRDLRPEVLTAKTVTDIAELKREVLQARERNYATTVDQLDYGITALAVPIRGLGGRTIAALNSSGYTGMVSPDQLVAERLTELQASAARLAHSIAKYPMAESIIGT